MTFQQLDKYHQARPFLPFTLFMADGRSFHVPHPEFLARSPSGRTVVVYGPDDTAEILDLLLMTTIQVPMPNSGGAAA